MKTFIVQIEFQDAYDYFEVRRTEILCICHSNCESEIEDKILKEYRTDNLNEISRLSFNDGEFTSFTKLKYIMLDNMKII